MNANSKIISFGNIDFKFNHLLIIGILILSFSISLLIRSLPMEYGWQLHEFDPFFNFRATEYIVENGVNQYFNWNDELSWYPYGRDVSENSQMMLHLVTATLYWIFGNGMNLYDFTIIFPAVIGSLTTLIIFLFVRLIAGTTAGLLSALFFSISMPIILRGFFGWFKSEPLGLFFGLLMTYLLLSGLNSNRRNITILKIISAGILVPISFSSWGGNQFFIIPISIYIISLTFVRNDHKFLFWSIPLFYFSIFIPSIFFERPGITTMLFGLIGLSLTFSTIFHLSSIGIQKKFKNHRLKFSAFLLIGFIIVASLVILFDDSMIRIPTHRYLNTINPLLTTTDPLTDSISEHSTTRIEQSFLFHSILIIFAGIGLWILLQKNLPNLFKKDLIIFSLIFGFMGTYIGSTFIRLEVFTSISIILLSSIGISILIKNLSMKSKENNFKLKNLFFTILIGILLIPLLIPNGNIYGYLDAPPVILNGGLQFDYASQDWILTLDWIKNNTPQDSVIAAWWDYGYWIQTLGERATITDNSTVNDQLIKNLAEIFYQKPNDAWKNLNDMGVDYFVIFVAAEPIAQIDPNAEQFYVLGRGGDDAKNYWIMHIAGIDRTKYLHSDNLTANQSFWNETLFGHLIPFRPMGFVNPQNQMVSFDYVPGWIEVSKKHIEWPESAIDAPFHLVYSSPSYDEEEIPLMIGVFVYELNKNYNYTP